MKIMHSLVLIPLLVCMINLLPEARASQNEYGLKDNPFLAPYGTPFNTPPFDRIRNGHFLPAIQEGIRRQQAEIDAIVNDPAPPTFANTMERSMPADYRSWK